MKYFLEGIDDLKVSHTDSLFSKNNPNILCMGICLNSSCMYNCIYCYAKDGQEYKYNERLKLTDYKKLIKSAAELGCKTVIITGVSSPSEPLLSCDLCSIVEYIASLKMKTLIYTNLYILGNKELCLRIHDKYPIELISMFFEQKVSLMVSCDSIKKEHYNEIVQLDAFDTFKNAMLLLNKAGFRGAEDKDGNVWSRIAISTVINRINISYLQEMQEFFHKYKWQFICKFPSLVGNAVKYPSLFFSPQEVLSLRPSTSNKFTDKRETLVIHTENKKKYCLANQLGIAINGKGQVLSCLSGSVIFDENQTVKNSSLAELVIQKKRMYGMNEGHCPKKKKYYED